MPMYDQYGQELISLGTNPQSLAQPIQQVGGPGRLLGSVNRRKRVLVQWMLSQAGNSAANTWYFSNPLYVDEFDELVLIASLGAAQSGTPATFQMALLMSDLATTLANSWMTHPNPVVGKEATIVSALAGVSGQAGSTGTALQVASPPTLQGPFTQAQYSNFGDLVRVGVSWGTAWGGAGVVNVYLKAKG